MKPGTVVPAGGAGKGGRGLLGALWRSGTKEAPRPEYKECMRSVKETSDDGNRRLRREGRNECGISGSFARRDCATQTAGPGNCCRKTKPTLLPSRGGRTMPRVMAPVNNHVLRRALLSRRFCGFGLAGTSASTGAPALERPRQTGDKQEQRQCRQQHCKDDPLHDDLITIVISAPPASFEARAVWRLNLSPERSAPADFFAGRTSVFHDRQALL